MVEGVDTAAYRGLVSLNDGGANNIVEILNTVTSTNHRAYTYVTVSRFDDQISLTLAALQRHKIIQAAKVGDYAFTADGSPAIRTSADNNSFPPLTTLCLGCLSAGSSGTFLNGWLRQIGIWNSRVPNSDLINLTT